MSETNLMDKMTYQIDGQSVYVENCNIVAHFIINNDDVFKEIKHCTGITINEFFHKLGDLPMNIEAMLLNQLRDAGKI